MKYTFNMNIAGEQKTCKMTFGLLNTLCEVVGDIDGAAMISVDPDIRTQVIKEILADRDSEGNTMGEVNMRTLDVDPSDVLNMVDWAGEHVLDFFIQALERTKGLQDKVKDRVKDLMPTSDGSEA